MGINYTILVTHRGENNQDLYVENIFLREVSPPLC